MNKSLPDNVSIARALANAFAVASLTAAALAIILLVASASARADQDLPAPLRNTGTEASTERTVTNAGVQLAESVATDATVVTDADAAGSAGSRPLTNYWKWYTQDSLYPTYGGR